MAQEKVYSLKIDGVDQSINSIEDLEEAVAQLDEQFRSAEFGSDEFKRLQGELQAAKSELDEFDASVQGVTSAQRAEGFLKLGQAAAGAFTILAVGAETFGASTEQVEKLQAKFQGLVAALDGVKLITEALSAENLRFVKSLFASTAATVKNTLVKAQETTATFAQTAAERGNTVAKIAATVATRGLQLALQSGPLLIIGGVIAAAAAAFLIFRDNTDEATEALKKQQRELDIINEKNRRRIFIEEAKARRIKIFGEENIQILLEEEEAIEKAFQTKKDLTEKEIELNRALGASDKEIFEDKQNLLNEEAISLGERAAKLKEASDEAITRARLISKEDREASAAFAETSRELAEESEDLLLKKQLLEKQIQINTIEFNKLNKAVDEGSLGFKEYNGNLEDYLELIDKIDSEEALRRAIEVNQERLRQLDVLYNKEVAALTDKLRLEQITEEQFNQEAITLDIEFAGRRLEATKEQYALEIEALKQAGATEQELRELQRARNEDIASQELDIAQKQLEAKRIFSEQEVAIEAEKANLIAQIQQQSIQLLNELFALSDIIFQNRINAITDQITAISERIEQNIQDSQDKLAFIQGIEEDLETARGRRRENLLEGLESERAAQIALAEEERQLAAEKVRREAELAAIERRQANLRKAQAISNAIINTALGIAQINANPVVNADITQTLRTILTALVASIGAAQIATISAQKFAKGGLLNGPSHSSGGIKGTGRFGNVEVEGGEYIVNKRSTQANAGIIRTINENPGKKFAISRVGADGGILTSGVPSGVSGALGASNLEKQIEGMSARLDNLEISPVVSVVDINSGQNRVKVIEQGAEL